MTIKLNNYEKAAEQAAEDVLYVIQPLLTDAASRLVKDSVEGVIRTSLLHYSVMEEIEALRKRLDNGEKIRA